MKKVFLLMMFLYHVDVSETLIASVSIKMFTFCRVMSQYRNVCQYDLASHVFALANKAYHAMIHEQKNQRFVISGESGAGKTVTANLVSSKIKLLEMPLKLKCLIA